MDQPLVWVKATKEDYASIDIVIDSEIEIAGKYVKHITHFTADQLNIIRLDPVRFEFVDANSISQ